MTVGVVREETFGCGGSQEIIVRTDEGKRSQIVSSQSMVETQRASQMNGIISAQTMLGGELNRLVHKRAINSDQHVFVLCINRQIGTRIAAGCLCDKPTSQLGGESSGYLDQLYLGHSNCLVRAVAARLNPDRASFGNIPFDQCAAVKVGRMSEPLAHSAPRASMMSSLAGWPPAWIGV
jgi:hypothetical protein